MLSLKNMVKTVLYIYLTKYVFEKRKKKSSEKGTNTEQRKREASYKNTYGQYK